VWSRPVTGKVWATAPQFCGLKILRDGSLAVDHAGECSQCLFDAGAHRLRLIQTGHDDRQLKRNVARFVHYWLQQSDPLKRVAIDTFLASSKGDVPVTVENLLGRHSR
jgi:hypothetical protein